MSIKKWEDYMRERDTATVNESANQATVEPSSGDAGRATGEPLDLTFRQEEEYKKMLDFLKGRKNVANGALGEKVEPPKNVAKGWFVVDEQSRGFWVNGAWSQDTAMVQDAVLDSEKAAGELARVVGGVVIPAEEIL